MKKILFLCIFIILVTTSYPYAVDVVTTVTQKYFSTGQTQMTATAASIVASNPNRSSVTVCNVSSNVVYLGNTNSVSSTTGKRLQSNECITMDRNYGAIFGVCASGVTSRVDYLEE